MLKRLLMVAYHFPPMNVSSGIQRTLRFAQYLPEFNWKPFVLTAHPRAYSGVSAASLAEVPPDLPVKRAFALDTAKHLSLHGAYPRWLALPDRWWSWWIGAVPVGLRLIRKVKPDALWSTYPIATAHFIAYTLHRITGIPWVADFRDPMVEPGYPSNPLERAAFDRIEAMTLKHCERAVFASSGALRLCAERHPDVPQSRLTIIENGYDEQSFAAAEQVAGQGSARAGPLVLVHSGTVYPSERDPRPFFTALSALYGNGTIGKGKLKVVLRATGNDAYLKRLIAQYGIDSIVTLEPSLSYRAALAEMLDADGLIVLQATNCNNQVPAKLYEYLRARRPILALTDPSGDTAAVLKNAGIDTIARLDSHEDISRLVGRFVELLRLQRAPVAREATIAAASRRSRTIELARVLDAVATDGRGARYQRPDSDRYS
jgi:glycosyltransferase involved in cell wall biosynthesis